MARRRDRLATLASEITVLETLLPKTLDVDAIVAALPKDDPFALADALVLLPNRRSARGLIDAFAHRLGGAALLPLVPAGLREAAYALGAPKWKVILSITMKAARAGVITGILLAVARIAGETAPLLFTALSNQFWTSNLGEPMASLPVTIFKFAMSPYENWQKLAWAGVFLITMGVLLLNIIARTVFRQR